MNDDKRKELELGMQLAALCDNYDPHDILKVLSAQIGILIYSCEKEPNSFDSIIALSNEVAKKSYQMSPLLEGVDIKDLTHLH